MRLSLYHKRPPDRQAKDDRPIVNHTHAATPCRLYACFAQPSVKRARRTTRPTGRCWSWTNLDQTTSYVPPDLLFRGEEKLLEDMPANPTPLDYFKLYFTDDVLDLLVVETNRYAEQYIQRNVVPPHSPVQNWTPTEKNEMLAFLGLTVLMGIVYKPRLAMYWSTDLVYKTTIFGDTMARDRFLLLLRFLHFADNDCLDATDPNRDRLHKIRTFVNLIRARCAEVYSPSKDVCVDESLVLFKGRVAFKQFIRSKRARFGIKLFELCTSNGILLDFLIYHGKMSEELMSDPTHDFQISERIPLTLMNKYLNKGHRLFLDNYYTTPTLALHLMKNGTKLVGTVRPNRRQFPRDLANADISRGESKFALSDTGVLAIKYRALQDKSNNKLKVVCLVSTDHADTVAASAKKDKDGNDIVKPTCVLDYNRSMGGVDLMDQQLESLLVIRKAYKWYKKLFFRFMLQCLLSAHRLYKLGGGREDFLKFLHDVVTQLLTFAPRLNPTATTLDSIARLIGRNHFPSKRPYEGRGGHRASRKKICRVLCAWHTHCDGRAR